MYTATDFISGISTSIQSASDATIANVAIANATIANYSANDLINGVSTFIQSASDAAFTNENISITNRSLDMIFALFQNPLALFDKLENENQEIFSRRYPGKLNTIGFDSLKQIYLFLEPHDACVLQTTCSFANDVFVNVSSHYWKQQCLKRFGSIIACSISKSSYYSEYINMHNADLDVEIEHTTAAIMSYDALNIARSKRVEGVIGMLSDIAWVDDERVAKALSKKRYMAMRTIITRNAEVVVAFKKATTALPREWPSSFLPLSRTMEDMDVTVLDSNLVFDGFIGYAVNLFKLRPEDEYLRRTVLWTLFRDIMVFETREAKLTYKSLLEPVALKSFWGVALDDFDDVKVRKDFPCFRWGSPRDLKSLQMSPSQRLETLRRQLENGRSSREIVRYSY